MKILLTGAQGFLGTRIAQTVPVIAAPSLRRASQDDLKRLVDETQPDVIMHTAAISDIGECEKYPDASMQANVILPEQIAKAAQGATLVVLSTDQVYGGSESRGPYREEEAQPINTYARHKLEMEQRVLDADPSAVLLRATWMYDMPVCGVKNRGNFLMNVLQAAMRGQSIAFPRNQMRGVTWAREAAQHMTVAAILPGGVYNFGSENELTIYDTAMMLAEELGIQIRLEEAPERHHLWMDCSKARQQGLDFCSSVDGLRACLRAYGLK